MVNGLYLMNMVVAFVDMLLGTSNNQIYLRNSNLHPTLFTEYHYVNSQCFLDGQFCQGDWFEPNQVTGGYMVRLMSDNDLIGSWWQVNASDFDTTTYSTYANDAGYHGVESRIRIGAAQNCGRNSDLFYVIGALSAGAIAGIVIGCVFGKKSPHNLPVYTHETTFVTILLTYLFRWCLARVDRHLDLLCAKLRYEL